MIILIGSHNLIKIKAKDLLHPKTIDTAYKCRIPYLFYPQSELPGFPFNRSINEYINGLMR